MERNHRIAPEAQPPPLEATYVTIVKDIVAKKIPEHKLSFDITLDEINRQITGDGLFQWESKESPGVKFLAGHLQVTPDLIQRIANKSSNSGLTESEDNSQRLQHYVYFIEPAFGIGDDGSALSALDMGIARFIAEMPKVARAKRVSEKPPTVDIFMVGSSTSLGGQATREFVDRVKKKGYDEYGKLYAEFVKEKLVGFDLDKTRIVFQGTSKGAITSDKTFTHLPEEIQERTQLLYDNPAGTHGSGVIERTLRSYGMGVGMAAEIGVRTFAGSVKGSVFAKQKEFYRAIANKLRIPADSEEQKKLKRELFLKGAMKWVALGTPLDNNKRSFSRISTPDPVNIDIGNMARVASGGISDKILRLSRRALILWPGNKKRLTVKEYGAKVGEDGKREKGGRLVFATGNTVHNFPWVRSIDSGSWAQKMEFVENTVLPTSTQLSHS